MKARFAFSLLLILSTFVSFGQIKFKPLIGGGAGFDNDNFFLFNFGLGVEKKIDINKSIETGIYYHNFEFNFGKNQYGFYEAFVQNTANDIYKDSITDYKVVFNFVSIPVGFNYYLSPRTYLNYKLGFNFFTSSTYQGQVAADSADYTDTESVFKEPFDKALFKKFYVSHDISINRIFFRRLDLGLNFFFTKSTFIKKTENDIFRTFNNAVSSYFAVGFNVRYFIFQIDSKKI